MFTLYLILSNLIMYPLMDKINQTIEEAIIVIKNISKGRFKSRSQE